MNYEQAYQWLHGDRVEYSGCRAAAECFEAEIRELRKDAERYRWLRNKADPDFEQPYVSIHRPNSWGKWINSWESGDECDAVIDAAMTAKEQA